MDGGRAGNAPNVVASSYSATMDPDLPLPTISVTYEMLLATEKATPTPTTNCPARSCPSEALQAVSTVPAM